MIEVNELPADVKEISRQFSFYASDNEPRFELARNFGDYPRTGRSSHSVLLPVSLYAIDIGQGARRSCYSA